MIFNHILCYKTFQSVGGTQQNMKYINITSPGHITPMAQTTKAVQTAHAIVVFQLGRYLWKEGETGPNEECNTIILNS